MNAKVRQIALEKLLPHPDNPNRMSRANFAKLVRHLRQTGQYEPLVVRPHPHKQGSFQIINGHHRFQALSTLGHKTVQAVVWEVDDEQTDVLLTTLNRLGGRDVLDRKLAILRRLSRKRSSRDLAKLLPQTRGQLERLVGLAPLSTATTKATELFAVPLVFFVSRTQQQTIENALSQAPVPPEATTRAARRAAALTHLATQNVNDL